MKPIPKKLLDAKKRYETIIERIEPFIEEDTYSTKNTAGKWVDSATAMLQLKDK